MTDPLDSMLHTVTIRTTPRHGRRRLIRLLPILLVLLGVVVLLYPVVATQYNNARQREFSQRYNQQVQEAAPDQLQGDLERARAYNGTLKGIPILDPWLPKVATDQGSEAYRDYLGQLDRFPVMARVRVPSVDIDLPVYHGTSDAVIAKGVGHLYGTSLPVGGTSTHAVLTSHTGMSNATLFDHLDRVKQGDTIFVDVAGETLAYQVDQIKVILPTQLDDLAMVSGHDYLTLFTCTPYAVNTHRLLVRAERVPYTADASQPPVSVASTFRLEPWMWALVGAAGLGLIALAVLTVRENRRRRAGTRLVTDPTPEPPAPSS